jgi:hypothetical protein
MYALSTARPRMACPYSGCSRAALDARAVDCTQDRSQHGYNSRSAVSHCPPTHTQTATPQGGAYGVADDEPLLASCPSPQARHSIPEPAYTAEGVDADQLLYARPMHRQGTTQSMQDAAFLFNKIAESIPECICACCQELHWRSQMQTCRLATLSWSPVQSLAAHFKPALPVEQGYKTWMAWMAWMACAVTTSPSTWSSTTPQALPMLRPHRRHQSPPPPLRSPSAQPNGIPPWTTLHGCPTRGRATPIRLNWPNASTPNSCAGGTPSRTRPWLIAIASVDVISHSCAPVHRGARLLPPTSHLVIVKHIKLGES